MIAAETHYYIARCQAIQNIIPWLAPYSQLYIKVSGNPYQVELLGYGVLSKDLKGIPIPNDWFILGEVDINEKQHSDALQLQINAFRAAFQTNRQEGHQ